MDRVEVGGARGQPSRDIVVVGASAGGVAALTTIAGGFPADLRAAIFVVLHLPEGATSYLADIVDRSGPLRAVRAEDRAEVVPGTITVCPPGCHLVVQPGHVRVVRGPRVNGHRPSVDVLFHSAARSYGGRVVGVVLSGTLSDGTLGLAAIKRRNGAAIVQADAIHQGMPTSAIQRIEVDAVVPLREIAAELTMRVNTREAAMADDDAIEDSELEAGFDVGQLREAPGSPTALRCPECGGALWDIEDSGLSGYTCHVGHTFSADSLLEEQGEQVERALWSAVRLLEERSALNQKLARRMEAGARSRRRFEARAQEASRQADLIREILDRPEEDEGEAA